MNKHCTAARRRFGRRGVPCTLAVIRDTPTANPFAAGSYTLARVHSTVHLNALHLALLYAFPACCTCAADEWALVAAPAWSFWFRVQLAKLKGCRKIITSRLEHSLPVTTLPSLPFFFCFPPSSAGISRSSSGPAFEPRPATANMSSPIQSQVRQRGPKDSSTKKRPLTPNNDAPLNMNGKVDATFDAITEAAREHGKQEWDHRIAFTIITALGFFTRFWGISHPNQVVFDEVHFGKVRELMHMMEYTQEADIEA